MNTVGFFSFELEQELPPNMHAKMPVAWIGDSNLFFGVGGCEYSINLDLLKVRWLTECLVKASTRPDEFVEGGSTGGLVVMVEADDEGWRNLSIRDNHSVFIYTIRSSCLAPFADYVKRAWRLANKFTQEITP